MRARAYRALHRPIGIGPDTITIDTEPVTLIFMGLTPTVQTKDLTHLALGYGPPTDTWLWLTYRNCMGLARPDELGTFSGTGPDNRSIWPPTYTLLGTPTDTGPKGTGPHQNYIGTAYGTPTGTGQDTSSVQARGYGLPADTGPFKPGGKWAIRH